MAKSEVAYPGTVSIDTGLTSFTPATAIENIFWCVWACGTGFGTVLALPLELPLNFRQGKAKAVAQSFNVPC